ncbi:MAG TPA: M23 family metallopeptidase [Gemmatimonadales bacterium]|nr:M23 family metallopeptidase [Gemmatimonadales bacterium]
MRIRVSLLASSLAFAGAAVSALTGNWPWPRMILGGSPPAGISDAPAVNPSDHVSIIESFDTLRRGEVVTMLLQRQGIADLELSPALDPRRLRAGLVFAFQRPHQDSLPNLVRVRSAPERLVRFERGSGGWNAEVETIAWRAEPMRIAGSIDASLYDALDASVPDDSLPSADRIRLAWDLADVFAWQVDFSRDVQPGDRFRVVFERLVSPEGETRLGRILASDLEIGGRRLTAFRFDSAGGRSALFDAGGNSLRRAFLRAPVEFRRISSQFARGRRHPILGTFRRHEGTDYAANRGTPVMAAGEGNVLRAGFAGGYGNLVELRHRSGITTRYAHLRGFARGIRAGARVGQGQVIGYVGATGLASGPHLHYEFRVNGIARDSRRVDFGNGEPLPRSHRAAFERERDRLAALLAGSEPQQPSVIAAQ